MKLVAILLTLTLLGAIVLSPQGKTHAQTPLTKELASQRYRENLDEYRKLDDRFAVAYQQYVNLRTLASQEEAVQTMRSLLVTRADVMLSYFDLVKVQLDQNAGADASRKATVFQNIALLQDDLKSHRNRSEIATDRLKVDAEAVFFLSKEKQMLVLSDQASALDMIGRMNNAFTSLEVLKRDIDLSIQQAQISETQKIEKQRGSEELGRSLQTIAQSIQDATAYYDRALAQSSLSNQNAQAVAQILASGYTQVLRAYEYSKELSQ